MSTSQVIHTSEIWVSATRPSLLISPQYPDFRFSCPKCGSLEVFIKKGNENLIMKCLDCANIEEINDSLYQ